MEHFFPFFTMFSQRFPTSCGQRRRLASDVHLYQTVKTHMGRNPKAEQEEKFYYPKSGVAAARWKTKTWAEQHWLNFTNTRLLPSPLLLSRDRPCDMLGCIKTPYVVIYNVRQVIWLSVCFTDNLNWIFWLSKKLKSTALMVIART